MVKRNHGLLLDCEAFSSTDISPEDYISNSTTLQVSLVPACSHSPKFYMRCIPIAKPPLEACWGLTSPAILPQWHQLGWPPWPRWWPRQLSRLGSASLCRKCWLCPLAATAQSRFGLSTMAALVIKGKGGAGLGACPHSLVTPEAPPWTGGRLSPEKQWLLWQGSAQCPPCLLALSASCFFN